MPKAKREKTNVRQVKPWETAAPASAPDTSSVSTTLNDNSSGSFRYGHLLIDLLLETVPAVDLIPLRCVNRYTRDFIDGKIFRHVTLKTDKGLTAVPVITGSQRRLPLPSVTPWSGLRTAHTLTEYIAKYTTVLDIRDIGGPTVLRLQAGMSKYSAISKLQVLRLISNDDGAHTYFLPKALGARTMVVFPSFNPRLEGENDRPCRTFVPRGVEKVVQHITFAVDWRGPVLFWFDPKRCRRRTNNLKNEVWIMTNAAIRIDWRHLGIPDDHVRQLRGRFRNEFCHEIHVRLKAGVDVTIVGLQRVHTEELLDLYHKSAQGVEYDLCETLRRTATEGQLCHLHFKTWDEYAAALSPEELEIESLPPGYFERWRSIEEKMYPGESEPVSPSSTFEESEIAHLRPSS